MTWLAIVFALALGGYVGGLTERHRWVTWARRNHPEQAKAERLKVL
jgi:hypothetical protein